MTGKENEYLQAVQRFVRNKNKYDCVIDYSAKLEHECQELSDRDDDQLKETEKELGVKSKIQDIVRAGYDRLHLQTFFTAGPKEVHSWTVRKGTKAPEAAGKIHTDMQKGFIRAEVMSYKDLAKYGSESEVKKAGQYRLEGKDYLVKDGDIFNFRFNVAKNIQKKEK